MNRSLQIANIAILLAACSSPKYTFDAADGSNSVVEYAQGVPVIYSQGTSSIVAVKPASRTMKGSEDLAFQVVVTNTGTQPFEITAEDVSLLLMRSGEATSYSALSFDEYAKVKEQEKTGSTSEAMGIVMMVAGGVLGGLGSGAGGMSAMSNANTLSSNGATLVGQSGNLDKTIDEQVSASDEVYLHRTTVQPGQTQAGTVYFDTSEVSNGDRFDIEVALPTDTHRVSFVLAQGQ